MIFSPLKVNEQQDNATEDQQRKEQLWINKQQERQASYSSQPCGAEGEQQHPYDEQSENKHRGSLC